MRILFVMRHTGYVRNFEWMLRLLAERSHRVHLGFEPDKGADDAASLAAQLAADTDGTITHGKVPPRDDRWRSLVFGLRQSVSYLRYLAPPYDADSVKLRRRWGRQTPRLVVRVAAAPVLGAPAVRTAFARAARAVERCTPRSETIDAYLRDGGFDLLLVTPLVDRATQHDWVRSARGLGIPAALAVASWDNLTNKGLMFEPPDRTYVWNEIQRREAADLHGLDRDSVVVTGAHPFDHWFDWRPSTTRAELCAETGLDPDRPFLLYVCSSGFIASDERAVVARWIEAVRHHPGLEQVGILVRPHPTKGRIWAEGSAASLPNVAVWPSLGADPTTVERRACLYDSIHHSAAVVGANTTALIDAAIVGRRTFSVLLPELQGGQQGTLHFHYLLRENGGPLTVAGSLEEHAGQLRDWLESEQDDSWRRAFLESFVRPFGLDEPAAPRFVDDLERWAGSRSLPAGAQRRTSRPARRPASAA